MPIETLRIESMAYTGQGVGRLADGKVVFVDSAVAGDLLSVKVQESHSGFARAHTLEVLEASPYRIPAICPYAALCGGCGLQQMTYGQQRFWKRRFVVDSLERIGGFGQIDHKVAELASAKDEWGYRNKIELVPLVKGSKISLGFHASGSDEVVPLKSCLLLPSGFTDLPAKLSGALSYALKDSAPTLRRVGIRISKQTGDLEVALWTAPSPCSRQFVSKVLESTVRTTSLVRVITGNQGKKRDVRGVEVLSGKGFWQERIGGFSFKVSAPSFFQVNTQAARILVDTVVDNMDADAQAVLDLYSGVGSFTLPLASRHEEVTAIESAKSSVRDLRRNLDDNGLMAEVVGGGVEYELAGFDHIDAMVVDPPRSGLTPQAIAAIIGLSPYSIRYVSCDPATLARDLKVLVSHGYELLKVIPIDLFPQTYHVESVALLTKP